MDTSFCLNHYLRFIVVGLFFLGNSTAFLAQTAEEINAPAVATTAGETTSEITQDEKEQPPTAAEAPSSAPIIAPPLEQSFPCNGNFQLATEDPAWPDGWEKTKDAPITRERDGEKHFLRFISQQDGQLVQIARVVPIPEGVKGIQIWMKFRTADVKSGEPPLCTARFAFQFQNADGRSVGRPKVIVFDSRAKNWTEVSRNYVVPANAVKMKIQPGIFKAQSGTLDLQEIRIAPMNATEAEAMAMAPILAAQREAELKTAIDQDLLLPPKTRGIKVSGNQLVTIAEGTPVKLQGVNVSSLEQSPKGERILASIKIAIDEWKANAIRLPVSNSLWFGRGLPPQSTSNNPEEYRKIIDDAVKLAAANDAYVILDLHLSRIPEESAVEFWKEAAARYKNHPAVLFDMFSDPAGMTWEVWCSGGNVSIRQRDKDPLIIPSPGMQGLVNAIRDTGAKNIVVASGLGRGYDLSGVLNGYALDDKGGNGVMYSTHLYNWHKKWQEHFLAVAEVHPVLVGEVGAYIKKVPFVAEKNQMDPYIWSPNVIAMIQKYNLNWTAFSFTPRAAPALLKNWNYEPSPHWGQYVKEALSGKQFEMTEQR